MKMNHKIIFCLLAVAGIATSCRPKDGGDTGNGDNTSTTESVKSPQFDDDNAYSYMAAQCAFGPRAVNTAAHDSCGQYIASTLKSLGAEVTDQYADMNLYDGTPVKVRNIIASYVPENTDRVMLCAHWDTRPWADHDPVETHHHTPIDGANDGASGVGVLLEVARQLQAQSPKIGVDLVFFDAEDCGVPSWASYEGDSENTWCLGSQHWAEQARQQGYRPRFGILLDMVGGVNSVFYKEGFSTYYAAGVVDQVWAAAQNAGYGDFFKSVDGGTYTDDHLPVNRIAGIPCIDIIATNPQSTGGFVDSWHTLSDNMRNIDKRTLKAVGQTLLNVIYNL